MGNIRYFLNLRKRYFGPYRVTRKLTDVTFEVESVDQPTRRRQTRDLVHVLRMKPYHDPEDQADLFKWMMSWMGLVEWAAMRLGDHFLRWLPLDIVDVGWRCNAGFLD
ncbi:hypothetical protein LAZ67_2005418 [Cordylochernes scorpioides]|uniref:Integrase p58-like C-terminal domain-containing protein n=1 Tax=Cordylochernes scorpioides TaxID=51811 RepID=A0ABY6K8Z1_9ARAC|nr:hypothetical protein LAZ67_2005418 [Cordylochernes scorpioides]